MSENDVLPPIVPPRFRVRSPGEPPICEYCKKRYLTLDDMPGVLKISPELLGMSDVGKLTHPTVLKYQLHICRHGKTYHVYCFVWYVSIKNLAKRLINPK